MNGILLGGACLGALVVILMANPATAANGDQLSAQDIGSMTTTIQIDPDTGDTTEINIIAFLD